MQFAQGQQKYYYEQIEHRCHRMAYGHSKQETQDSQRQPQRLEQDGV